MKFKLKALSILFLTSSVYGEIYKGCGENEERAREELAKSIYVSVTSEFQRSEKVEGDIGERTLKNVSKQTTDLKLSGVKLFKDNNRICATATTEDLKRSLSSISAEINSFNIATISKDPKVAKIELSEKLELCESGKRLSSVLGDNKTLSSLSLKGGALKTRLEAILTQSVKFNLSDGKIKISIDGSKTTYKINEDIFLKEGKHLYLISSENHCPISGEFELNSDEVLEIDNIDLQDYLYPKITFTSNKETNSISLDVGGEHKPVNRDFIVPKCEGVINYRAEYSDGKHMEENIGEISLKPSLVKSIHLEFLSISDMKKLENEAESYKNGNRLEFLYSYGYVTKDQDYKKDTHNFEINFLTHKRFFRYGYGAMFGANKTTSPDTKVAEIYYILAVQFSSFGENNLPLRIGKTFSFIPYLGVEMGVGYHEFRYKDEKIISYPREGDDDAEKSPEDWDWSFRRDALVVKPIIGIDFILSRGFAFKIFAERNIYIDERWFFGTGLSVEF